MKYVRTKYGIRYIISFKTEEHEIEVCHKLGYKYADTIEELCDEFVFIDENGKPRFCYRNWIKDMSKAFKHIYGCIWTDKGLIYVAKMNQNGELELL